MHLVLGFCKQERQLETLLETPKPKSVIWIGMEWKFLGGVRFRAPYGAKNADSEAVQVPG